MSSVEDTVRAQRLAAQGIGQALPDIVSAVRHLVAVQAQSWTGALLAVRARVPDVRARDVERLVSSGELVVSWLNRGTLHLVHRDDFDWLHTLTAPPKASALRGRLQRLGISADHTDELVTQSSEFVTADREVTKDEISQHLTRLANAFDALTTAQLLESAAQRRLVVRGPQRGSEVTYVSADAWIGTASALPTRDELVEQLVRRYCVSHWPSTPSDAAAWAGVPVGPVKRAWSAAAREGANTSDSPNVRVTQLLGQFDPILHGWTDRKWILGDHVGRIITSNGIFRPVVLVNNLGVGTWKLVNGRVEFDLFTAVGAHDREALERDAESVAEFLSRED